MNLLIVEDNELVLYQLLRQVAAQSAITVAGVDVGEAKKSALTAWQARAVRSGLPAGLACLSREMRHSGEKS